MLIKFNQCFSTKPQITQPLNDEGFHFQQVSLLKMILNLKNFKGTWIASCGAWANENRLHKSVPIVPKVNPNFPKKFSFKFNDFYNILNNVNNFYIVGLLNDIKQSQNTHTHPRLYNNTKNVVGQLWFGKSRHDKQSKQTIFFC